MLTRLKLIAQRRPMPARYGVMQNTLSTSVLSLLVAALGTKATLEADLATKDQAEPHPYQYLNRA